MTQSSDFKNFLDHVNLDQRRLDTLAQRVAVLQKYLGSDPEYKDRFEELIPQGSFAHGTIIKPVGNREFDADVLLPMNEVEGWTAKDYIQNLYTAFGRSHHYKTMRGRHTRCVRIDYSGDFHVDVVPYITRSDGQTYIANRTTDTFERSAPDDFTAWLEQKNRITNGNLVKVVRLLKYLRDHKGTYKIASVVLTTLIAQQVNDGTAAFVVDAYKGPVNTLRTLSTALATYLAPYQTTAPYITDPSGTGQDLSDRWEDANYVAFRSRFTRHSELIAQACDAATYDEALKTWRSLFGDKFGILAAESALATVIKASASPGTPNTEKFLDRDFRIATRLNPNYTCHMEGTVVPRRGFKNVPLPKRGDLVDKGRSLVFAITKCTVPEPYDVYWKVRNNGEEANNAAQLRGDITKDDGTRQRRERTAYRGHHYVEAMIVKDGYCVATSRQSVKVI